MSYTLGLSTVGKKRRRVLGDGNLLEEPVIGKTNLECKTVTPRSF